MTWLYRLVPRHLPRQRTAAAQAEAAAEAGAEAPEAELAALHEEEDDYYGDEDEVAPVDFVFDPRNPLSPDTHSFYEFSVTGRLLLLKALCDWRVMSDDDQSNGTKWMRDEFLKQADVDDQDMRVTPLGEDRHGKTYWYFGDNSRVYREPYSRQHPGLQGLGYAGTLFSSRVWGMRETVSETATPPG